MSSISHGSSAGSTQPQIALPRALMSGAPFCDYLNVTVPVDSGDLVLSDLRPLLDVMGLSEVRPGLFQLGADGGTFKYSHRGKVAILSASGAFLAALRLRGRFSEYLTVLSCYPHRVSMLHATADFAVDGPPVIAKLHRRGRRGHLALTRKSVAPSAVIALLSSDVSGRSTGTIYIGHRQNADVWAKVYDKRHERITKGFPDPGPVVRVEIAVQSDVGATLQDAQNPASLFFHFASRTLVEGSPVDRAWVASGEGFKASERSFEATVSERIRSILDSSLDVARICQLARDEFGEDAGKVLSRLVANRVAQRGAICASSELA